MGKTGPVDDGSAIASCQTCGRDGRCRPLPYPVTFYRASGDSELRFVLMWCCWECTDRYLEETRRHMAANTPAEIIAAWNLEFNQATTASDVDSMILLLAAQRQGHHSE